MTEQRDSALNWAEKLTIATSAVTITLDFTAVAPVLPKMREVFAHYPNADLLVKMLIGVIGASMVIGCPMAGWMAKRINHRILISASLLLYAVSGGLGLVISDLYLLLATRCVIGFAAAVGSTVALLMLSELTQGHARNFWIGIIISASMFTAVISYPLAGILGEINWRLPYAMYVVTLPLAVICFLFVRDVYSKGADPEEKSLSVIQNLQAIPYRLLFLALIKGLVTYLPTIYVPFHLYEIGIKDPRVIGTAMMAATIVGSIGSSMYGPMRRKFEIYQSLSLALFITAIGMTAVASSSTLISVIGGMLIYGVGIAWLSPNIYAIATMLPDRERAVGLGLTKACGYSASFIGVILFEPIYKILGGAGVLLTDSFLALALIIYVLKNRVRFSERTQNRAVSVTT